jgi:integrase
MLQQSRYLYLLIPPKTEAYGEDLLYVSRQMGHSSLSVTGQIYAHQIRERRPEAAAKTDAMIFG